MSKIKYLLETIYLCMALIFFSKELVNDDTTDFFKEIQRCGVSI